MADREMKYTYLIHESENLIAATIQTNEPLPHIEVGHELLLWTDEYHGKSGSVLVVQAVRVVMGRHREGFERYDIHVVCQEQESPLGI